MLCTKCRNATVYQKQVRTKGKFKEKTRHKKTSEETMTASKEWLQVAAHSPGRRLQVDDKGDIIE